MWLTEDQWVALWLSLKLAGFSSCLLLIICLLVVLSLRRLPNIAQSFLYALLTMPMVLPPTVIGFYLLILLGPSGPIQSLGLPNLLFSFEGLLLASIIYSLPFVLQPIRVAVEQIDHRQWLAASLLGANNIQKIFRWLLPTIKPALIVAFMMGFAHTLGEFGVVLMIGGSIKGETQVVAIELFKQVELFQYNNAHRLSAVLMLIAVSLMMLIQIWQRKAQKIV